MGKLIYSDTYGLWYRIPVKFSTYYYVGHKVRTFAYEDYVALLQKIDSSAILCHIRMRFIREIREPIWSNEHDSERTSYGSRKTQHSSTKSVHLRDLWSHCLSPNHNLSFLYLQLFATHYLQQNHIYRWNLNYCFRCKDYICLKQSQKD